MKHLSYVLLAILGLVLFSGCEKETIEPEPQIVCTLLSSTQTEPGSSGSRNSNFIYDDDGRLIEIDKSDTGSPNPTTVFSITYTTNNKIDKIEERQIGVLLKTTQFSYTGDKLTQVEETESDNGLTYITVYTLTWTGADLTNISITLDGTQVSEWRDITWLDGNMQNGVFESNGEAMHFNALYDDQKNLGRHLPPFGEELILHYNTNNLVSVELAQDTELGGQSFAAGSKIMHRTLTYTSEGEVATITTHPSAFDDPGSGDREEVFTFSCE